MDSIQGEPEQFTLQTWKNKQIKLNPIYMVKQDSRQGFIEKLDTEQDR